MGALAPGFRFCPTEEELLIYYLRPKALGKAFPSSTIADVDIYKFEPWDLPCKSAISTNDPEWYFFSTQDKKYSHTARINRTTNRGYWKATGKDRKVYSGPCIVGLKKTLIYYEGRAPNGKRTNWVMHEYKLDQESEKEKGTSVSVLCRIRKKGGPGPRNGEQYGASVWNEDGETDEELKSGKARVPNDTGLQEGRKMDGNAFNLQNQVQDLRSPRRSNSVKIEHSDIDSNANSTKTTSKALNWSLTRHDTANVFDADGIMACRTDSNVELKSNPCFDTASYMWEDPLSWHQSNMDFQDMGTLLDLESLSSLADFDGHNLHDYASPDYGGPEILGEIWSLVNDSHCGLGSKEIGRGKVGPQLASKVLPDNISHVGCDYVEIDDIEAPFSMRSPVLADAFTVTRPSTTGVIQDPLTSQGSATRTVRLQLPASSWSEGRVKLAYAQTLQPEVETHIYGGHADTITIESDGKAGASVKNTSVHGSYYGSNLEFFEAPHALESSTRSYLSRHMSTYAVSNVKVAPPQPCYASVANNRDGHVEPTHKTYSSTSSSLEDENPLDIEKLKELCYASFIDINEGSHKVDKGRGSLIALPTKNEKQIDLDALGKTAVCSLDATTSTSLLTKHQNSEGNKPEGMALGPFKVGKSCKWYPVGSRPISENASFHGGKSDLNPPKVSSLRKHSLRTSLRGIKNKLKQTSLGAKFIQLEDGVRTKFNVKLAGSEKSAAHLLPTKDDDINPFDRLKCGILAILYHLAMAVLILSCLFYGYHIATKYASDVSVQ